MYMYVYVYIICIYICIYSHLWRLGAGRGACSWLIDSTCTCLSLLSVVLFRCRMDTDHVYSRLNAWVVRQIRVNHLSCRMFNRRVSSKDIESQSLCCLLGGCQVKYDVRVVQTTSSSPAYMEVIFQGYLPETSIVLAFVNERVVRSAEVGGRLPIGRHNTGMASRGQSIKCRSGLLLPQEKDVQLEGYPLVTRTTPGRCLHEAPLSLSARFTFLGRWVWCGVP